ncbi:hypothetical protein CONPUDRAFT_168125 [Coniophora puteana RWD-64-598 SS2]|uniref:4-carboxymuconolactone decarboxylase n=1 Tax=Coniophora puteana (strain RWD-64-598) TaxID=741705 RepID=A0A5M3MCY6_CONPW|nr:uncharacterized protein CONPUDRAFT_168125 [Coniophora puteana RWD-64-598 SS2]EIW77112.1 hypothetical protein CONPUDRAFT_168125 [Coniophora puteana RWD-64-598 SS2]
MDIKHGHPPPTIVGTTLDRSSQSSPLMSPSIPAESNDTLELGSSIRIPPIDPSNPPPQLSNDPTFTSALSATLARRRTQGGLNALDQTLLYSPVLTQGWNGLLGAVRTGCTLSDDLRELAICRVAVLNRAKFEWIQHARLLKEAWIKRMKSDRSGIGGEGVIGLANAEAELEKGADEVLRLVEQAPVHVLGTLAEYESARLHWEDRGRKVALDEKALAVLAYTDAMTRNVVVPEAIWRQLKDAFADEEERRDRLLVEITGTVAAYNCVSRFLVALDVAGMERWDVETEAK